MKLLDGKAASAAVLDEVKNKVDIALNKGMRKPGLAAVLVGENGASQTYVNSKIKTCDRIGFISKFIHLSDSVSETKLLEVVDSLNQDTTIDGILVQLPLPPHINSQNIINAIHPDKDVDGFHPMNLGKLVLGLDGFIPATPYGIMLLMEHFDLHVSGFNAVVLGRSNIVGTPMSLILSRNSKFANCTVTLCHSKTKDIETVCQQADLLIAALGIPHYVKGSMVKEGAIVIDVGITRVEDATLDKGYKIVGDVDFNHVAPKCNWITPVPGGVGAMTIAALMKNTLKAYENRINQ
jgi:methylenetetrahydrofolate dehydrogenase (NADP+)/methenyltetrahydrofolate cyclohydrolase